MLGNQLKMFQLRNKANNVWSRKPLRTIGMNITISMDYSEWKQIKYTSIRTSYKLMTKLKYLQNFLFICHKSFVKHNKLLYIFLKLEIVNLHNYSSFVRSQSITFEASDRSRSLPLALSYFPASELSLAPIREIARYKLCLSKR